MSYPESVDALVDLQDTDTVRNYPSQEKTHRKTNTAARDLRGEIDRHKANDHDFVRLHEVAHVHVQTTPSATWTIAHNLGYYPSANVVDSADTVVEGTVRYPDVNTVVLEFGAGFSGRAFLT